MENLDKAIEKVSNDKADEVFNNLQEHDLDAVYDFVHQAVQELGGYYSGSDVYDAGDQGYATKLLNVDDEDEFSMDYDMVDDIKEAYASDIQYKFSEDDQDNELIGLKSFSDLYEIAKDNNFFDGTKEEFLNLLKRSVEFNTFVYDLLTEPRG